MSDEVVKKLCIDVQERPHDFMVVNKEWSSTGLQVCLVCRNCGEKRTVNFK